MAGSKSKLSTEAVCLPETPYKEHFAMLYNATTGVASRDRALRCLRDASRQERCSIICLYCPMGH